MRFIRDTSATGQGISKNEIIRSYAQSKYRAAMENDKISRLGREFQPRPCSRCGDHPRMASSPYCSGCRW